MKVRLGLLPLIAAALLASAPAGAQETKKLAVPYVQFTLPNGLDVILHEDHRVPMVAVSAWYHVGSAREKPGRTGFAHLFEHIMFEGSGHVAEGNFDNWLEAAGGDNNGSTDNDRTNYWETVPSNALELALFLESDRMGYLLDAMSPEKVNIQRDVVKNERRQSYENRPYGMAFLKLPEELFPPSHPYHWPVIGSMEDLTSASYEDVVQFFKSWYGPNNTSLVELVNAKAGALQDSVQRLDPLRFDVLLAGAATTPAHEMFRSPRLEMVIKEAREQYDYVLLDTPPIGLVSDCGLLAPLADGLLLVVAAHKTPRKMLESSLNQLDGDAVLGIVYNGDDRPIFGYRSSYYQGYFPRTEKPSSTAIGGQ